jgi:hypothetical protein
MDFVTMQTIYETLSKYSNLPQVLTMEAAMRFVRLAAYLKRAIIHLLKSCTNEDSPPLKLPQEILQFLASAMQLTYEQTTGCWEAFRNSVWNYSSIEHSANADTCLFYAHGREHQLSESKTLKLSIKTLNTQHYVTVSKSLYPPITRCNNPLCTAEDKILKVTSTAGRKIVLYTVEDGACASYHFKLRCSGQFYIPCKSLS